MFSLPVRKRRTPPHICLCLQELERRALLSAVQAPPVSSVSSTNWSGYAAVTNLDAPASNAVTEVSGSWTVPTVTGIDGVSSVWVGIDGYSSKTVEQIGTEQNTSDTSYLGAPYFAWYEMYPDSSVEIPLSISAGNKISASVTYNSSGNSSGLFTLDIENDTTGDEFSTTQSVPSGNTALRSSAEWIVEEPSYSIYGFPLPWLSLANFNTVNFTGAQATFNNGITGPIDNNPSWENTAINMVSDAGTTIAQTSALTDTTTTTPPPITTSSFSVTYKGTSTGSATLGFGQRKD